MTTESPAQSLEELARALGVTRSYYDGTGQARRASDDALVAVVRALGAPVARIEDAPDALRALGERDSGADAAIVVEEGRSADVVVDGLPAGRARALLVLESSDSIRLDAAPLEDGRVRVTIPAGVPAGYHRLDVESASVRRTRRILAGPSRLPSAEKGWGLFAPLYALRGKGAPPNELANYGDLARLARWMVASAPGSSHGRDTAWLGTLPLLACFFEEPFEPSPYSPISRAFWSELYVDPRLAPECEGLEPERGRLTTDAPPVPPSRELIDYRRAMRDKRARLERLLTNLDRRGGARR